MEDILTSPEWMRDMMKAAVFTHDEHMNDLVSTIDPVLNKRIAHEDSKIFTGFLSRACSLWDNYQLAKEWKDYPVGEFRKRLISDYGFREQVFTVVKDYVITPTKIEAFVDKIRKWLNNSYKKEKETWLNATPAPYKSVMMLVRSKTNTPTNELINQELEVLKQDYQGNGDLSLTDDAIGKALKFQYDFDLDNLGKTNEKSSKDIAFRLYSVIQRKYRNLDLFFNDESIREPFFKDSDISLEEILKLSESEINSDVVKGVKSLTREYRQKYNELLEASRDYVYSEASRYSIGGAYESIDIHPDIWDELIEKIKNATFVFDFDSDVEGRSRKNLKNYLSRVTKNISLTRLGETSDEMPPSTDDEDLNPEDPEGYDNWHEEPGLSSKNEIVITLIIDLYLKEKRRREENSRTLGLILTLILEIFDSDFGERFMEWLDHEELIKYFSPEQTDSPPDVNKSNRILLYLQNCYPELELTHNNRRDWLRRGKEIVIEELRKKNLLPKQAKD